MLPAQLEVVFLHVWQDWPSQIAFVCFLAVRRCEMEKAVKNVHLWLDGTQNNYVKTPFLPSLEGYSMCPSFFISILRDNGCRKKGKCFFSTELNIYAKLCIF